jgi:hypothetical protein
MVDMGKCYELVRKFKDKYPLTVAFRLRKHSAVVDMHLNPDENLIYAFTAQKNDSSFMIINTCVVGLTNKRLVIGIKRLLWGYFFISITPDMFNDLKVKGGIIWGKVNIDTVKELITLSNIDIAALPEIETAVSSYMIQIKKKFGNSVKDKD